MYTGEVPYMCQHQKVEQVKKTIFKKSVYLKHSSDISHHNSVQYFAMDLLTNCTQIFLQIPPFSYLGNLNWCSII